ncbi:hypothetical protein GLYMA_18G278150v4 [Glycine max]|nr:hypothetical protein GLYMA_18G278150v4 [Glycine max]KAG4378128.1 hypothetical protein GLYMA_18G278150v4 [Glycine max]KAH1156475.1 hypothetical protein GYH30_051327 [Glycine max]KAH1156476.1 hypothetical protein GYH30_051327 [Glycine max]
MDLPFPSDPNHTQIFNFVGRGGLIQICFAFKFQSCMIDSSKRFKYTQKSHAATFGNLD